MRIMQNLQYNSVLTGENDTLCARPDVAVSYKRHLSNILLGNCSALTRPSRPRPTFRIAMRARIGKALLDE
jgi:hypothetical protein